jgi:hypothetical protein
MSTIVGKIVELHHALDQHQVPHAFGGALALAWCTKQARGTIDIDINVFITAAKIDLLANALPDEVTISSADRTSLEANGQVRLHWGSVPVDIFLNTTEFHESVASRVRYETFGGASVPFIGCTDLAIFKCIFNRSRDWVDLEEMVAIGSLDIETATGTLLRYLGPDDERIGRLQKLAAGLD